MAKTPWYMDRINEETNKRRISENKERQLTREIEEIVSLLENYQTEKSDFAVEDWFACFTA